MLLLKNRNLLLNVDVSRGLVQESTVKWANPIHDRELTQVEVDAVDETSRLVFHMFTFQ
jgi:hypothetical protein